MTDLYAISVPVLRHYVTQIGAVLDVAEGQPDAMTYQVADGVFPAGRQLSVAMGFALRATYPVCGKDLPPIQWGATKVDEVRTFQQQTLANLDALTPADFENPPATIDHKAGFAELSQDPFTYVTQFAMPNFFFHMVAGYTALRAKGLPLSKSHFDGLHEYPEEFSF